MQDVHPTTIMNTTLPASFRRIRLELAREPEHPAGEADTAYIIVAPLNADDRIDAELWKHHRDPCRVARLRPDGSQTLGHLVHRPGGSWAFRYDISGDTPDEIGYHFSDERFVVGEYLSLQEEGATHTFRITSVTRL